MPLDFQPDAPTQTLDFQPDGTALDFKPDAQVLDFQPDTQTQTTPQEAAQTALNTYSTIAGNISRVIPVMNALTEAQKARQAQMEANRQANQQAREESAKPWHQRLAEAIAGGPASEGGDFSPTLEGTPITEATEGANTGITLPEMPKDYGLPPSVASILRSASPKGFEVPAEAYKFAKTLPEFMSKPGALAMLPLGAAEPLVGRLIAGGFAADTIKAAKEIADNAGENWDKMTDQQKVQAFVQFAGSGLLATQMGAHALKGEAEAISGTNEETKVPPKPVDLSNLQTEMREAQGKGLLKPQESNASPTPPVVSPSATEAARPAEPRPADQTTAVPEVATAPAGAEANAAVPSPAGNEGDVREKPAGQSAVPGTESAVKATSPTIGEVTRQNVPRGTPDKSAAEMTPEEFASASAGAGPNDPITQAAVMGKSGHVYTAGIHMQAYELAKEAGDEPAQGFDRESSVGYVTKSGRYIPAIVAESRHAKLTGESLATTEPVGKPPYRDFDPDHVRAVREAMETGKPYSEEAAKTYGIQPKLDFAAQSGDIHPQDESSRSIGDAQTGTEKAPEGQPSGNPGEFKPAGPDVGPRTGQGQLPANGPEVSAGKKPGPSSPWFLRPRSDGVPDVLDAIQEEGGIRVTNEGGEDDGAKEAFQGPARVLLRSDTGKRVDLLIQALREHGYTFQSPDELYNAVSKAQKSRDALNFGRNDEEAQNTFLNAALENKGKSAAEKGKITKAVNDLKIGDQFKLKGEWLRVISIDPDDGTVTVQDGTRFGTQELPPDVEIYPDKGKDTFRPSPENPLPPLPKQEAAAVPKLRPGEKGTGDLLQGEDAPFNLAGEEATDYERIQREKAKAEQTKREAAEIASKQQQTMSLGPGAASPEQLQAARVVALDNAMRDREAKSERQDFEAAHSELYPDSSPEDVERDWQNYQKARGAQKVEGSKPIASAADEALGITTKPPGEPQQTSIKNRIVDEERAARGEEPLETVVRRSNPETWDKATRAIADYPQLPARTMAELAADPERAPNAHEEAILGHEKITKMNEAAEMSKAAEDAKAAGNDALVDEYRRRIAVNEAEQAAMDALTQRGGTALGRGLQYRKVMYENDYSITSLERKARASKNFEPLTEAEKDQIRQQHDALEKNQIAQDEAAADIPGEYKKEIDNLLRQEKARQTLSPDYHPAILEQAEKIVKWLEAKADKANARLAGKLFSPTPQMVADVTIVTAARMARGGLEIAKWTAEMVGKFGDGFKPYAKDIWDAAEKQLKTGEDGQPLPPKVQKILKNQPLHERIVRAREALKAKLEAARTEPDEDVRNERKSEAGKIVQKLARMIVEQDNLGIGDREVLLDKIHGELQESIPDITRREAAEALSGYGEWTTPAQDVVSKTLRSIKGQIQKVLGIEDILKKGAAEPTGLRRDPMDQPNRELTKKRNEAKKEAARLGIVVKDPATALKSYLQTKETRLTNRIEDLKQEIADGKLAQKQGAPRVTNERITTLEAELKAVSDQHKAIFGKQMDDAARLRAAESMAERNEAAWKEKLERAKRGDFGPEPVAPKQQSAKLDAIRARTEALKAERDEISAHDAAHQESLRVKPLEDSIAALEKKINEHNLSPDSPAKKASTPAIDALRAIRDQTRRILENERDIATRPERERLAAQKENDRQIAAVRESTAEYERKIQSGEFEAEQTPAKAITDALKQARLERDQTRRIFQDAKRESERPGREAETARKKGERDMATAQRRLDAVNKQIAEYERQINEGVPQRTPITKPELGPDTNALDAARTIRDQTKAIVDKIRADQRPRATPEEIAIKTQVTRLTNRNADMLDRLAKGEYEAAPRRVPVRSPEIDLLQQEGNGIKLAIDRANAQRKLDTMTKGEKAARVLLKLRRMSILSGPSLFEKLGTAVAYKAAFNPIVDQVGNVIGKIPGLRGIAAKAQFQGGTLSLRTEAAVARRSFMLGIQDGWQSLKNRDNPLKAQYGKDTVEPRSWLDYAGKVHEAIKAPLLRLSFERAYEKGMQREIENGGNPHDLETQMRVGLGAYKYAERQIFQQPNSFAKGIDAFTATLERRGLPGAAFVVKGALPVKTVPLNIAGEVLEHAFGLVTGSRRIAKAYRAGVDSLAPEDADIIMRQLKNGAVGNAAIALGFLAPQFFGGTYEPKEKRPKTDVQPGSFRIAGHDVPANAAHNPIIRASQMGADVARVASQSWLKSHPDDKKGYLAGLFQAGEGLAYETPLAHEIVGGTPDFSHKFTPETYVGGRMRDLVVPQAVQQTGKFIDQEPGNFSVLSPNTAKRNPTNFWQSIETGIPWMRETVQKK